MDFQQRLQKAIERGKRANDEQIKAERDREINEKELQRLHSQYRLELGERIERCLEQVANQFPGFQQESIVGERGWGSGISRDDIHLSRHAGRSNSFSRLEMVIRPYSSYHLLELAAKGTVKNREVFNRSQYQRLDEADLTSFTEMIDHWALEFAELFVSKS